MRLPLSIKTQFIFYKVFTLIAAFFVAATVVYGPKGVAPDPNILGLAESRVRQYENWRVLALGSGHHCGLPDLAQAHKQTLYEISQKFHEDGLVTTDGGISETENLAFIRAVLKWQNEINFLLWYRAGNEYIKNIKISAFEEQTTCQKLIAQELRHVQANHPGRFLQNHEMSEKIIRLHYDDGATDRYFKIQQAAAEFNLICEEAEKMIGEQATADLFNASVNFGWNLDQIFNYEMVRTQYCLESQYE